MDTGAAVVGIGVLIALFAYLETIRRDLRGEMRDLRGDVKDVRQASDTAHKEIQLRLGNVETQLAAITARVDCIDDKVITFSADWMMPNEATDRNASKNICFAI